MNVLFVDQFGEIGGAQKCLLDLLDGWPDCGRLVLAAPEGGNLAARARAAGAVTHALPCGPYRAGTKAPSDACRFVHDISRQQTILRSIIDAWSIDVCYVNGPRVLPAAALATAGRCGLVFHAHNRVRHGHERALVRLALRYCGGTGIACCEFVGQPLGLKVIRNGVADAGFRKKARGVSGVKQIGIIGRISPEKGHGLLLEAVRTLVAERFRIGITVVGSERFSPAGHEAAVRSRADGLDVQFTGWVEEIAPLLASFDLLAVPSVAEPGLPRVVLEAFAAGVPVVALPTGGIPEAVRDGETGFLARGKTATDLLATLRRALLATPAELQRIAENARAEWVTYWNVERWRAEVMSVIRSAARVTWKAAA